MARRQSNGLSMPTQNNFTLTEQIKDLKHELQLKNQQIEDLNYQLSTLRQKQSIWHHIGQTYQKTNIEQQRKTLSGQNQKLKSQICSMLNELERKNKMIEEQGEKIDDLKQYNNSIKKLNQKWEILHKKQTESETVRVNAQLNSLRMQRQKLHSKLSKCQQIAKEMEQFYVGEINMFKQQIQQQRNVIVRLEKNKIYLQQQLNKKQKQNQQMKSKLSKNNTLSESRQKQNDFNQLFKRQTIQKKFQLMLTQTKQKYQKQTSQLKDQIRFLLLKVESLQQSKGGMNTIQAALTTSVLTQSKFALSSASSDSFRFTPSNFNINNSFSSSIKESLSRKDAGPLRTPSKSCRQHNPNNCGNNHIGYLLDRTNL